MIMLFCGKVTYMNKAMTLDTTARGNGDLERWGAGVEYHFQEI